jgi:hypothetical protein
MGGGTGTGWGDGLESLVEEETGKNLIKEILSLN